MTTNSRPTNQKDRNKPAFISWWNHVNTAMSFSLRRLWFNPISTWITLAAIAIALSLPTGLHLFLKNLQTLTDDQRQIPTVSLFLHEGVTEQQAQDRADLISELDGVTKVIVQNSEVAFAHMSELMGGKETLESLGKQNIFPHVLVVTPDLSLSDERHIPIQELIKTLKSYPEVKSAQSDIEWVVKLRAIIMIATRIVWVFGSLLGLTVLLVVGNTIRLDIENRKEEIDVTRFIGGTRAYIRRPFIFGGLWYGLFGGIISLVVVHTSLLFLIPPVDKLAKLYSSHFTLSGLDFTTTFYILIISCSLGVLGAWVAVSRHLRKQEVIL
ncbi:MAG: permease-like cell division protein FtsX [Thiotrichaceae bacterium]|nr:permease-like cell division protein FtsX [Thiotrichaceae bacterium]